MIEGARSECAEKTRAPRNGWRAVAIKNVLLLSLLLGQELFFSCRDHVQDPIRYCPPGGRVQPAVFEVLHHVASWSCIGHLASLSQKKQIVYLLKDSGAGLMKTGNDSAAEP